MRNAHVVVVGGLLAALALSISRLGLEVGSITFIELIQVFESATNEIILIGAALQGQWFPGLAAVVVLALAGAFWRHRRFNRSLAASS